MFDLDSDYVVEQYIKPTKVSKKLINDERGDILGNFDDEDDKHTKKKTKKAKEVVSVASEENPFDDVADEDNDDEEAANDNEDNEMESENDGEAEEENDADSDAISEADDDVDSNDENDETMEDTEENETVVEEEETPSASETTESNKKPPKAKNKKAKAEKAKPPTPKKVELSDDQMKALIRGSCKQDRFVLYVTNLNYSTNSDGLRDFFRVAGTVKSVRIPKVRRSAFAFVEMTDLASFKNALALHNRTLDNYTIKVQISEGGKKKSANKKNILKQKNRKLAEMRNEGKAFQRSGKGYDKTIKKELKQRAMEISRRIAKKQAKKSNK